MVTQFIVTRWEHINFLRSNQQNLVDVCTIAKLDKSADANSLLTVLDLDRDELNSTAHDIDVGSTIDLFLWMGQESTDHVARAIGWPMTNMTPQYIAVFRAAIRALLPPACKNIRPSQAMEKYGNNSLKKYVWTNRSYTSVARQLRRRAQEWGARLLSEKQAAFFASAQEQGHCVSLTKLKSVVDTEVATEVASMRENINRMVTLLKSKYPGEEEIWDALILPKVAKEETE